ncbi:hypothetical protein SAMN05445504_9342 [Burkholderia sp. CF099]|nr:hypothetical protein SAMN05445504_9342 [Burkholderia sp. CF099]
MPRGVVGVKGMSLVCPLRKEIDQPAVSNQMLYTENPCFKVRKPEDT